MNRTKNLRFLMDSMEIKRINTEYYSEFMQEFFMEISKGNKAIKRSVTKKIRTNQKIYVNRFVDLITNFAVLDKVDGIVLDLGESQEYIFSPEEFQYITLPLFKLPYTALFYTVLTKNDREVDIQYDEILINQRSVNMNGHLIQYIDKYIVSIKDGRMEIDLNHGSAIKSNL